MAKHLTLLPSQPKRCMNCSHRLVDTVPTFGSVYHHSCTVLGSAAALPARCEDPAPLSRVPAASPVHLSSTDGCLSAVWGSGTAPACPPSWVRRSDPPDDRLSPDPGSLRSATPDAALWPLPPPRPRRSRIQLPHPLRFSASLSPPACLPEFLTSAERLAAGLAGAAAAALPLGPSSLRPFVRRSELLPPMGGPVPMSAARLRSLAYSRSMLAPDLAPAAALGRSADGPACSSADALRCGGCVATALAAASTAAVNRKSAARLRSLAYLRSASSLARAARLRSLAYSRWAAAGDGSGDPPRRSAGAGAATDAVRGPRPCAACSAARTSSSSDSARGARVAALAAVMPMPGGSSGGGGSTCTAYRG
jgi:hypothetical protein